MRVMYEKRSGPHLSYQAGHVLQPMSHHPAVEVRMELEDFEALYQLSPQAMRGWLEKMIALFSTATPGSNEPRGV